VGKDASEEVAGRSSFAFAFALTFAFAFAGTASALELGPPGVGCAGDGSPSRKVQPSGYLSGALVPLAGRDVDPRFGDPVAGDGLVLRTARLALCGRVEIRHTTLWYVLAYEPWDELERARTDATSWGRFTAAELGWSPWRWLTIWAGIHKVAFSFGHDEPEGALALPLRPALASSIAPDRRLGLTADVALGAARLAAGFYESARELAELGDRAQQGFLVTGRGLIEPIGPVGSSVSTLYDAPEWLRRPRFGLDFSAFYEWTRDSSSFAVGGDVPFKWGPLGVVVEYLYDSGSALERPSALAQPRIPRQGLTAQASVMVWRPHVELEARYEWLDETRPLRDRFHAFTAGLSVYELEGIVRVQLAYTRKLHRTGAYDDQAALLAITLQR
jgi:hypothetical protein